MSKNFCMIFIIAIIFAFVGLSYAEEKEIKAWDIDKMIHKDLKSYFTKTPEMNITPETLDDIRKESVKTRPLLENDPAVEISDELINKDFSVRVYKPKGKHNKKLPGLLWIHGGGHILGSPEDNDSLMCEIVKRAKCIVVQPDYDLAPEYPYPTDLNQCMEALKWLADNSQVDSNKIAVAGMSAGGGLTAAVTLKARDEKGVKICFQMPLYPMLDYRSNTTSIYQMNSDKRAWCRELNITAWAMYLGGKQPDIYASPALAEDLSNLPPAYIMVGTLDPFRDEAINYAQKLMQAGVPVEFHVIPGVTHAFEVLYPDADISKKARDEYINALANALK